MKRKSFLHPTNMTGVFGQNRFIWAYHISLQFSKELARPISKHMRTTSDLQKEKNKLRSEVWENEHENYFSYSIMKIVDDLVMVKPGTVTKIDEARTKKVWES